MKIIESWLLIVFFAVLIFVFKQIEIALFVLALLWVGSIEQIHILKKLFEPKKEI